MMERLYYLSNWLWRHHIPFLPRLIMLVIRVLFVSYIPYDVEIGPGVNFGHKIGIVINPTAKIGAHVKIRHMVGIAGGPVTIGDDVEIGAGARLMGRIKIGNGARIGANACVVKDVPPNTTVVGVPARIVKWRGCARQTHDVRGNQGNSALDSVDSGAVDEFWGG